MQLTVCYPAYRSQLHAGHVIQTAHLVRAAGIENRIDTAFVDCCFLDLARNHLIHTAMKSGSDVALMCDADTFSMDIPGIVNMLNTGAELGAAVIAAPVPLRGRPDYNAQNGKTYLPKEEWQGKVIPVDRVGTAFMAINLRWLRERWEKHPWFESRIIENPDGSDVPIKMSEDFEFCDGVRARGGTVYLDGRLEPHHAGITSETITWVPAGGYTKPA